MGASMSRWAVRKIGVMWSVEDFGGDNYELFHRWDEAMAYADRQARTIQVTLPTKVLLPGVDLSWNKHGFIEIHAEGNPIDLENLGTALLTLHHRKRVRVFQ